MQTIAETCVCFDAAHLSINLVSEMAVHVPMFATLRLRDRRAVGMARQFLQPRLSRTESKLAKSNLLDTKQGG